MTTWKRRGALAVLLLAAACAREPAVVRRSWPTMGTFASVEAVADDEARATAAVESVRATFDAVAAAMSNWSPDSELSRLNREAGRGSYRIADADLARCLSEGLDGARRTNGAFDPTVGALVTLWGFRPKAPRVPSEAEIAEALTRVGASKVHLEASTIRFDRDGLEIDLGGLAKGCALDVARERLNEERGIVSLSLDLGGQWAHAWRAAPETAIADPRDRERTIARVKLPPGASIATSSNSENHFEVDGVSYGHILDPRTGRPASTDVIQATAIDRSATVVEILGKALVVSGTEGAAAILARYPTAEAVLVVRDGDRFALVASATLEGRLTPGPEASTRFVLPAATIPDGGR